MPGCIKRLVPCLLSAFMALSFVCCAAENPDLPATEASPVSVAAPSEAPCPFFADGARTLAVIRRLGDAERPLCLSLDAAPGVIDGFSGVLTICALGDDLACRLDSGGGELGMLLSGDTAWVIQFDGRTYYKSSGEEMLALRDRLRGLSSGGEYSFDCGETVFEAEAFDYESFVDGGSSITMLFPPGTDELRYVIVDRNPITVLRFSDSIPDGFFELPEGFSEIYP